MGLRIAVIGKNGQTAQALAALAGGDVELVHGGSAEADLRDAASLARFVESARPGAVINTGAYNFVDRAEAEPDEAMRVNADGPRALARITRRMGLPFIHMSTDCVFDGRRIGAYDEADTPNPLSAYGRSKRAGEIAVAEEYPEALTARVCWVFSELADNFFSKMIELARTRSVLRVVKDQIGAPTYARDVATGLLKIAREKAAGGTDLSGLLHLAAPEVTSRAEMAVAIMNQSRALGGPFAEVEPVATAEFSATAERPLNAQLSGARATARLGLTWTPFAEALPRSVAGVLAR